MQATLIHNAGAGDGNLSRDELVALLDAAGLAATCVDSKAPDLAAALNQPVDLVVVAGGDGTVLRVVAQLAHPEVPLLILPLGTANNIASTFNVKGDPRDLIAGWCRADKVKLAVGTAVGPWGRRAFVEGLGVGAFAAAMRAVEEQDASSEERAHRALDLARDKLAAARPERLCLQVDGQEVAESALQLQVLNIRTFGPSLWMAPQAQPGDDVLDVVVVEERQREAVLRWLDDPQRRSGAPATTCRGREVRFLWHGAPLHLDDQFPDPPDRPSHVTLTLAGSSVTLLTPEGA
jgi:diacylglycerol kinase family enzyme